MKFTGSSSTGFSSKTGFSFSSKGASGILIGISTGAEVNNEFSASGKIVCGSGISFSSSSFLRALTAFLASTFSARFSFHFAKR